MSTTKTQRPPAPRRGAQVFKAERDDEALHELTEGRAAWLDDQFRLARLFHRMDVKAAYFFAGCESVAEYASRQGYDGEQVVKLTLLGYSLEAHPEIEGLLRDTQMGFLNACAVGEIARAQFRSTRYEDGCPAVEPDDDWVAWARFERLRDVKRRIRKRLAEVKIAQGDHGVGEAGTGPSGTRYAGGQVAPQTADDFTRAQEIASKKAQRLLSRGELMNVLVTDYLLNNDPEAETPRTRRMPHTGTRLDDRGVARKVAREIDLRSGLLCEFGSCDKPARDRCHLKPHAEGSARELLDLVNGCKGHHRAFDNGRIRFLGWTNDGLPTFIVNETNEILRPKPRPRKRVWETWPDWLVQALSDPAKRRLAAWRKRAKAAEEAEEKACGSGGASSTGSGSGSGTGAGMIRDRAPPIWRPRAGELRLDSYRSRAAQPTYALIR